MKEHLFPLLLQLLCLLFFILQFLTTISSKFTITNVGYILTSVDFWILPRKFWIWSKVNSVYFLILSIFLLLNWCHNINAFSNLGITTNWLFRNTKIPYAALEEDVIVSQLGTPNYCNWYRTEDYYIYSFFMSPKIYIFLNHIQYSNIR